MVCNLWLKHFLATPTGIFNGTIFFSFLGKTNSLKPFFSVCLPDGTVQVTNPNVGLYSHVFAVQDEGVSAAVKCSVATSGAESNITGCSQVNFTHY